MAGFALVLRFFTTAFATAAIDWPLIFAVLSVLSMTLGNIVAFVQTNIKRLLAYSSIAAAGYIMIGLASGTDLGASGLIFFLLSYAFTNLGAFIAVIAISEQIGSDDIADYAGLARRAPLLAFTLTFCLVSLLGIPPTAGFVAKFYLFAGAVQQGILWLAVIGVINSAISAYYYIKVVRAMYLLEPKTPAPVKVSAPVALALLASVAGVLLVFIFAWPIIGVTEAASRSLFLR
jgi:NADH-quinone oxidoreductase subunit N